MTSPYLWMKHPTLPDDDPVQTPRQAFESVHQHLGWEEAPEVAGPTQADLDATLRPPPEPEPDEPDAPAPTGGRSATRSKAAGPSKGKE